MNKPVAWSYTSLTAFETCPFRYYVTRVSKEVIEPPNETTIWGNEVHKAFELHVKDAKPMPASMEKWAPLAAKLRMTPGEKLVEQKLCINRDFKPTSWFAKDAWCRGVVDLAVRKDHEKIVAFDYKTGKHKPDSHQMQLFAGLMFAHYPAAQVVDTAFIWLKDNKTDQERYTRDDVPVIWQEFVPRVQRVEEAHVANRWPKKPSGLCRAWCPVGKKRCEHCGKD